MLEARKAAKEASGRPVAPRGPPPPRPGVHNAGHAQQRAEARRGGAHRRGRPPVQRGDPRPRLPEARLAPGDAGRRGRDRLRGLGAGGQRGSRSSASGTAGGRTATPCASGASRASSRASCRGSAPAPCTSTTCVSRGGGYAVDKADPFAFRHETPPRTASVVWDLDYAWGDREWMSGRGAAATRSRPPARSTRCTSARGGAIPDERQPLAHLPRDRPAARRVRAKRWGSPTSSSCRSRSTRSTARGATRSTGYFAATSRYGTPQDLMYLIDTCTSAASASSSTGCRRTSRPTSTGSAYFDGTHLYEHADPRQGFHPDWGSFIFNYGRHEVRSFLLVERAVLARQVPRRRAARRRGRVDALPRLLAQGGRVDPEPVRRQGEPRRDRLPRRFNEEVYRDYPDVQTIAEESTAWPMVSRPDVRRRARLRLQVGHGLDARHAAVPGARPDPPQVPPQRAHVPDALRVQRELRAAALARRGRPRQGLAARQDAGRRVAEVRQPAAAVRVHVRPARARSCCSWAARSASGTSGITTRASTGTCSTTRRTAACRPGSGT